MLKVNHLLLSLFVLFASGLQAQIDAYPFLRTDKNEIYIPSKTSFKLFFDKLKKLQSGEKEKVHILHIGDSHIQADIFSGRVRQRFADDYRFGIGARGFLFPYRLAKSNNPEDFQVLYTGSWEGKRCALPSEYSRWGLAGVTAQTRDVNATFSIIPNIKSVQNEIIRVKVFYPSADSYSFHIVLIPEEDNQIVSQLRTSDFVEFTLAQPQQKVKFALQKTSPIQNNFLLQGISLENNDQGVIYSASGVNGAKVSSYIRCVAFERNLQALKPDLVIISLGTNDAFFDDFNPATFKSNYRYLIDKIRKVAPHAGILLTTPGDSYRRRRYPNPDMQVAVNKIVEIGRELGVAVWNFYEVMGGFRSVELWQRHLLYQNDYVHLTHQGYILQGDLLYEAFDKAYRAFAK